MSLPSNVIFKQDGYPLAYGFCNIGWSVIKSGLMGCVVSAIESAEDHDPEKSSNPFDWDSEWKRKWTHAHLYGIAISREHLDHCWKNGTELDDAELVQDEVTR